MLSLLRRGRDGLRGVRHGLRLRRGGLWHVGYVRGGLRDVRHDRHPEPIGQHAFLHVWGLRDGAEHGEPRLHAGEPDVVKLDMSIVRDVDRPYRKAYEDLCLNPRLVE